MSDLSSDRWSGLAAGPEVGVRSRSRSGWFQGSSRVPPGGDELCRWWWFTDRPDKEVQGFYFWTQQLSWCVLFSSLGGIRVHANALSVRPPVAEEVQISPSVRLDPPLLGVHPSSSLCPAAEVSGPAAFSWRLVLMPTQDSLL